MPGRKYNGGDYRYGYQGSEKDDEIAGEGNSYTTHFRQLDTRIGRWLSVDPEFKAFESPYVYMGNNPIWYNDPLGDTFEVPVNDEKAKGDVRSTAKKRKYADLIKFDKNTGRVSIDWESSGKTGDDLEAYKSKALDKGGLQLVNDLIEANELMYYATEGPTNITTNDPSAVNISNKYWLGDVNSLKGKKLYEEGGKTAYDARQFIFNASTTPYVKGKSLGWVPTDHYDGKLFIAKGTFYKMY